jgi:hypothetical protein
MKKEASSALLAYFTERHHWAVEELRKEQTPERVTFYLYIKIVYEREIMKLRKLGFNN